MVCVVLQHGRQDDTAARACLGHAERMFRDREIKKLQLLEMDRVLLYAAVDVHPVTDAAAVVEVGTSFEQHIQSCEHGSRIGHGVWVTVFGSGQIIKRSVDGTLLLTDNACN